MTRNVWERCWTPPPAWVFRSKPCSCRTQGGSRILKERPFERQDVWQPARRDSQGSWGFVVYHAQLPPGTKRDTFCAIMSLLPGTLPCGPAEGNGLIIHCLDVTQPVVEQLAAEEALCMQTLGGAQRNG